MTAALTAGGLAEGRAEDTAPPAEIVTRVKTHAYAHGDVDVDVDVDVERARAWRELRAALPPAGLDDALRCSARLLAALPYRDDLRRNRVLVAYGGGKDSSYTLAFVRALQLILHQVHGETFRMRVATNRHAGMPRAVMENIDREYTALRLTADPDCELLLVDGDEISVFDVDSPQRDQVVRRNRLDILMTGHRVFADGRPTFCNACNVSVFNAFGIAAAYDGGADLVITGDSGDEQRQYTAWVGRMARRLAPGDLAARPATDATGSRAENAAPSGRGFGRLLGHLDRIGQAYFADIHGADAVDALAERRIHAAVPDRLRFFSIYSDTAYRAGDHLELLTGFLGFRFDDVAFSFTESDCANPALMAHLRALKCEHVFQRSYEEGLAEYVEFALGLMRAKDYPPELIAVMRARYEAPGAVDRMRAAMATYAVETFGLTEEQLVCMAYSPFAQKGAGLEQFLTREHPQLASRVDEIRELLGAAGAADGGESGDEPGNGLRGGAGGGSTARLVAALERISGLELARLRVLYGSSLLRPGVGAVGAVGTGSSGAAEAIEVVLAGDPHKAVIDTRHAPDGPVIFEQISGR